MWWCSAMGGLSSTCFPGIRCFTASSPLRRSWACAWSKGSGNRLSTWRSVILLALPALAVPVNSVAALYCVGDRWHSVVLGAPGRNAVLAADRCYVLPVSRSLEDYGLWPRHGRGASHDERAHSMAMVGVGVMVDCGLGIPDRSLPLDLAPLEGSSFRSGPCQCHGILGVFLSVPTCGWQGALRHIFPAKHLQHICLLPGDLRMLAAAANDPK